MSATEINRLMNEIRALVLAASDMRQAAAAAEALANEHQNVHLMRALETAVVVCYWRPFASANQVKLNAEERVPADEGVRLAHELLKNLRDKVFAHTDRVIEINGRTLRPRDVERSEDLLGPVPEIDYSDPASPPVFTESWHPLDRKALPTIVSLARAQEAQFRAKQLELEAELRTRESAGG
jgi:hypothetical protein